MSIAVRFLCSGGILFLAGLMFGGYTVRVPRYQRVAHVIVASGFTIMVAAGLFIIWTAP